MSAITIPNFKQILLNFEKDGHIEIQNCVFGYFQVLLLDNENYTGYISKHGIKIVDKTLKKTIYSDVFMKALPLYTKHFIKDDPVHFDIEFLDKFDKFDRMKEYLICVSYST